MLVGLGWLAVARVEELTDGSGRLLHQQMAFSAIALVVTLLLTIPHYRCSAVSATVVLLAIVLLAAVYFFPPINHAHRWIVWGRWGCNLRNWPRWRMCWRWPLPDVSR